MKFLSFVCVTFLCASAKISTDYSTVRIGSQEWMTTDLRTTTFQNGDKIKYAQSIEEWNLACSKEIPAYCIYEVENAKTNVYLYNHYAITDPRRLAPMNMKVPSSSDWKKLSAYIKKNNIEVRDVKSWRKQERVASKVNFNAVPTGFRKPMPIYRPNMNFYGYGEFAAWWSTSPGPYGSAERVVLTSNSDSLSIYSYTNKESGFAVRLIKEQK